MTSSRRETQRHFRSRLLRLLCSNYFVILQFRVKRELPQEILHPSNVRILTFSGRTLIHILNTLKLCIWSHLHVQLQTVTTAFVIIRTFTFDLIFIFCPSAKYLQLWWSMKSEKCVSEQKSLHVHILGFSSHSQCFVWRKKLLALNTYITLSSKG